MIHLDDARLFAVIARAPSLSAAARTLGRSPSSVSTALQRLEARLGVGLVQRTTRAMELTAEGTRFGEVCDALVSVWAAGERDLRAAKGSLEGAIRVAAPVDLAQQHLAPWCAGFVRAHPEVQITLLVDDAYQPLPGRGVDVAFRYGVPDDSSVVGTRIAEVPRWVVASPDYLDRAGRPSHPSALRDHTAVAWLREGRPHALWTLSQGETVVEVTVRPQLVGDGALVRRWALDGHGVAYKSALDVIEDLRAGTLENVLPGWQGAPAPLMALLPAGRRRAYRVERLIAHVREAAAGLG